jgi:antitoxin component of RelBE/YafQ-DinJ toxin-antitoxin module
MRINPQLKQQVDELYRSLGMTLSEATTIFFYKSLMVRGLPFEIRLGKDIIMENKSHEDEISLTAQKIIDKYKPAFEELGK